MSPGTGQPSHSIATATGSLVTEAVVGNIRGYELRERIAVGGSGVIYRAYQSAVGREVAIKVIRPEFANRPDFIRRFEAEAQLVARLEHPYIVPLFDYWRDSQGAYLVTRWFQAGNLEAALKRGPWSLDSAVNLVDQISQAVACAHRHGVVHLDLKPANILLDQEGNCYLSDFGIATDLGEIVADDAGSRVGGTPGYAAPEQIRGASVTSSADIYALGIILFEMLAAEPPFSAASAIELLHLHLVEPMPHLTKLRPDLPEAVDAVVQRATMKEPGQRFPDALALATAFRQAIELEAVPPTTEPVRNPYKGLRPFQQADAVDFFGREKLVQQLCTRMGAPGTASRFLAVVGPSGSGKSSIVKAGLVPALRRGALPGSEKWFYLEMFPGADPLAELEAALLTIAVDPPSGLLRLLLEDQNGLKRAVTEVLPGAGTELVLVLDQFEEVFSLVKDEAVRNHFLGSLVTAVSDPDSRLRLVVTLRADFYDRPLHYPEIGELMKSQTEVVLPLSASEMERAITGPAEKVGVKFDMGLLAKLMDDVSGQPGALPLLQYALTELFELRRNGKLTLEAYEHGGGVFGALSGRAESIYGELNEAGKQLARQLLLHLVTLGKSSEERRRDLLRSDLTSLVAEPEAMQRVIDVFGEYRLLTFDRDPDSRAPTVEIAHEALLREWARLRDWIEGSREDLVTYRRLASAAAEWHAVGRNPGFLATGGRLKQFERWANSSGLGLTPSEADFLKSSIRLRSRGRIWPRVLAGLVGGALGGVFGLFTSSLMGRFEPELLGPQIFGSIVIGMLFGLFISLGTSLGEFITRKRRGSALIGGFAAGALLGAIISLPSDAGSSGSFFALGITVCSFFGAGIGLSLVLGRTLPVRRAIGARAVVGALGSLPLTAIFDDVLLVAFVGFGMAVALGYIDDRSRTT